MLYTRQIYENTVTSDVDIIIRTNRVNLEASLSVVLNKKKMQCKCELWQQYFVHK